MGAGGSCLRETHSATAFSPFPKKHQKIDPKIPPIDAGHSESYNSTEIREIKVNEDFSVLVSKFDGEFYSYGSKCPHYGAPLASGVLMEGLVKCPWHGACFDIRTGDIEDCPGLDCIPTYPVVKGELGNLTVYPDPKEYGIYKVQRPYSTVTNPNSLIIIVGAGASGLSCAQTLREKNWGGRILMITQDCYLPYDRTKLSKVLGASWEDVKLRDESWFKQAKIEIILNAEVQGIDTDHQTIKIAGYNDPLIYEKILIATGLRPRMPTPGRSGLIGHDLKNIMCLYDLKDSEKIREKAIGKNVVIMGSGFIAMELLGPLNLICKAMTVVIRSTRPYGIVLGETVGRLVQSTCTKRYKKLTFITCDEVKRAIGNSSGEVEKVITLKRRELKCDLLIFAIGGVPNTDFINSYDAMGRRKSQKIRMIREAPLGMLPTGYIPVNDCMETHYTNHYAAGDIVRFPTKFAITNIAQVAHWGLAQKMGRIAAMRMMGVEDEESIQNVVPFFWTSVAGMNLRYIGYGENFNHTVIFGDLMALKFCVLYKRDWKILACCTCNCDPIAARLSFDLQDNIYFEDKHPPYITSVFKAPPIVGDTVYGLKYTAESSVVDFDLISNSIRDVKVHRRIKQFKSFKFKDTEYYDKPLITMYERIYYENKLRNTPNIKHARDDAFNDFYGDRDKIMMFGAATRMHLIRHLTMPSRKLYW